MGSNPAIPTNSSSSWTQRGRGGRIARGAELEFIFRLRFVHRFAGCSFRGDCAGFGRCVGREQDNSRDVDGLRTVPRLCVVVSSRLLKAPGRLQVRELRPDEDATFRKIHHAAVHGLAAGHYPQTILDSWSRPMREGEGVQPRRDGQIRLVAELDGQPVGIGALFPDKSELDAVYVLPSAVRKGVGTALVREIERIAIERGVKRLHLDASLNAEPFYLATGYEAVERGEHVLNSGQRMACVRMAKDLG